MAAWVRRSARRANALDAGPGRRSFGMDSIYTCVCVSSLSFTEVSMVQLGSTVLDSVTGFQGVATIRAEHLHGSPRIAVEGPGRDGLPVEPQWFDEGRLKVQEEASGSP
jgi:hypothetical protein